MAWDSRRSTLYTATECKYQMSNYTGGSDYRSARIPPWAETHLPRGNSEDEDEDGGDGGDGGDNDDDDEPNPTSSSNTRKRTRAGKETAYRRTRRRSGSYGEPSDDECGEDGSDESADEEDEEQEDGYQWGDYDDDDDQEWDDDAFEEEYGGLAKPWSGKLCPPRPSTRYEKYCWPRNAENREDHYGHTYDAQRSLLCKFRATSMCVSSG